MRPLVAGLLAAALAWGATATFALADTTPEDGLTIGSVDTEDHPEVRFTIRVPGDLADVRVVEDGEDRDVDFSQESSASLRVVLLIDVTGSMGGEPIAAARDAATVFLEQLDDDVDIAVLSYAVETEVVSPFGSTREEHLEGVAGLQAQGNTAIYDAVITTLEEVLPELGQDDRQAVVLLTDGEDNSSVATLDETIAAVAAADISLDGVAYQTSSSDEAGLRALVDAGGGQVTDADDPEALVAAYAQLAEDLVNRYRVQYRSERSGPTEVALEALTEDGTTLVSTLTVPLPELADEPAEEEAADEPAEVAPSPANPRTALLVGAGAWFAALITLLLILFVPREGRAQRLAAGRSRGGTREVSALTERVTLVTGRTLERRGYRRGLNASLERAGIELRPEEFVVLVLAVAAIATLAGGLFGGVLGALVAGPLVILVARTTVSVMAERRRAAFAAQLGDTLQLLTGSLRAGYSLMQAVDAVARDADSPTAEEFSRLVVETRLGRDATATLSSLAERMGSDDFAWVVQAITIHREVGGDLAEVLDNVGGTIREREEIRRQIKTVSAEGRLSGWVLIALPIVMALWLTISNPTYIGELTNGGVLGWGLLGLAGTLMVAGALWIRALVRLRF